MKQLDKIIRRIEGSPRIGREINLSAVRLFLGEGGVEGAWRGVEGEWRGWRGSGGGTRKQSLCPTLFKNLWV